jgi:signal transduction histidine kinase
VTSILTMALVGRLIKPVNRLLAGLEELKHVHTQVGESNTPIEPIKIEAKAVSAELNNLQSSIVWFSNEVAAADHQLRSSVTGYETLLSSLPLGVMEIDRDYQLRFRNDAMSQITGDSAEASYGLRQRAEKLFESGETLDEYALSLEGQPQRNLLLAITPRTDESGEDSGFWLLVTDLTKQKAMDSQLLQTAKLATLGEMSTGMAHELNQPLNIIKLALSNLKNSLEKGRATEESIISRLDRIDSAVARASTIIDHMRAFGRVAGEDYTPFIVSSCISTASDLVREPMNANGISLFLDVETQASVLGNAIQFEQVLINMINNARDAILAHGSSGSITIRQILEAESVTITIEDTGGGIPAEALPHIFEPFYTTKPVGKGTGLGGSISYGIIQDMQGSIWAENVIGGARISIRLPLHVAGDELETEIKV